jgi:hypothetical protein
MLHEMIHAATGLGEADDYRGSEDDQLNDQPSRK